MDHSFMFSTTMGLPLQQDVNRAALLPRNQDATLVPPVSEFNGESCESSERTPSASASSGSIKKKNALSAVLDKKVKNKPQTMKPRGKPGKVPFYFSLDQLSAYFHLPISEAAKELGVCITVLKKICRQHGVNRWPQRKIKSLEKTINRLESQATMFSPSNTDNVKTFRTQLMEGAKASIRGEIEKTNIKIEQQHEELPPIAIRVSSVGQTQSVQLQANAPVHVAASQKAGRLADSTELLRQQQMLINSQVMRMEQNHNAGLLGNLLAPNSLNASGILGNFSGLLRSNGNYLNALANAPIIPSVDASNLLNNNSLNHVNNTNTSNFELQASDVGLPTNNINQLHALYQQQLLLMNSNGLPSTNASSANNCGNPIADLNNDFHL